jgi:hypothetical protein
LAALLLSLLTVLGLTPAPTGAVALASTGTDGRLVVSSTSVPVVFPVVLGPAWYSMIGDASSTSAERNVFPGASAFWEPIPTGPRIDPRSNEISAKLAEKGKARVAQLYQYGNPIVEADASTPRYQLTVRYQGDGPGLWGYNDLASTTVPIPDGALPSSGTDGKLTIIDRSTRMVYDLWQMQRSGSKWTVGWGGVYPMDGDGSSPNPAYGTDGATWPAPLSRGTGSGMATYLGTIRMAELAAGHISHAVSINTDIVCGPAQTGQFRWPATTTDGTITSGTCLPEGARVQLDPALDLSLIPGITQAELVLGRALQTYGGIVNDGGASRMGFSFETPQPNQANPYPAAGLAWDFYGLDRLPWTSLRVLAAWDGR